MSIMDPAKVCNGWVYFMRQLVSTVQLHVSAYVCAHVCVCMSLCVLVCVFTCICVCVYLYFVCDVCVCPCVRTQWMGFFLCNGISVLFDCRPLCVIMCVRACMCLCLCVCVFCAYVCVFVCAFVRACETDMVGRARGKTEDERYVCFRKKEWQAYKSGRRGNEEGNVNLNRSLNNDSDDRDNVSMRISLLCTTIGLTGRTAVQACRKYSGP